MNIKETKKEFLNDLKTNKFSVNSIDKLHLNVTTVNANLAYSSLVFGYSFSTIIMFSVGGLNIVTNEVWGVSTQKHKSQVTRNLNSYSSTIDLDKGIFDYLLNELLKGNILELDNLKEFITDSNIKVIKINNRNTENIWDYLQNNQFLSSNYSLKDDLKNIIRYKLYGTNELIINNEIIIKENDNIYECNLFEKTYKNLSFLNKINLDKIKSII